MTYTQKRRYDKARHCTRSQSSEPNTQSVRRVTTQLDRDQNRVERVRNTDITDGVIARTITVNARVAAAVETAVVRARAAVEAEIAVGVTTEVTAETDGVGGIAVKTAGLQRVVGMNLRKNTSICGSIELLNLKSRDSTRRRLTCGREYSIIDGTQRPRLIIKAQD